MCRASAISRYESPSSSRSTSSSRNRVGKPLMACWMADASSVWSSSVSGLVVGLALLCRSSSNGSVGTCKRGPYHPAHVLRTIRKNQARPLPPVNVPKYRRARSDASCTISSASSSFRVSQRANRYPASRCGNTTSSKLSPSAAAVSGSHTVLLMEHLEDLLDSLREGRIAEAETVATKSNVREHRVRLEVLGENGTDDDPGGSRRHAPDTELSVAEPRERLGELRQANRIVVHQKVPGAVFTMLGKMHERSSTVMHVNGRHPWPVRSKLQYAAGSDDRLDHARPKP